MAKFILGRNFEGQVNGINRHKIDKHILTDYGFVLAFEVEFCRKPEGERYKTVCLPYFWDMPKENGSEILKIGDCVPEYQRGAIEKTLREKGYRGEIKW